MVKFKFLHLKVFGYVEHIIFDKIACEVDTDGVGRKPLLAKCQGDLDTDLIIFLFPHNSSAGKSFQSLMLDGNSFYTAYSIYITDYFIVSTSEYV